MGKKGNWFSAVKKALSPEPREKKDKKGNKKKTNGFGEQKESFPASSSVETVPARHIPPSPPEEVILIEAENEQSKHAYSVVPDTAVAAESAVAADQVAAEVAHLTSVNRFSGKSREDVAAIKIQTAFRGYLARKELRAVRGLARLKSLIQGKSVKRQATTTLRCMQTLSRVQSRIHTRRIRMSEENQAMQRQLQLKREKELERLRASEEWDDSIQSKEQIEANLLHKQDAAMRRERALAYAFTNQQMCKNSSRSTNPALTDPINPHWGWSWLERWMAARPWESRSMIDKESINDHASVKSLNYSISGAEISKAYAHRDVNFNADKPSPTGQKPNCHSHQSPSTPMSKAGSSVAGKLKLPSPRGNTREHDENSQSMLGMQPKRYRRHTIAGSSIGDDRSIAESSVRDDESLASSPAFPSYMAATKSAKAKSRLQSPLGIEKSGTPEKGPSTGSAKKRLSFLASPAGPRRHSVPPKLDSSPLTDIGVLTEQSVGNGGSS